MSDEESELRTPTDPPVHRIKVCGTVVGYTDEGPEDAETIVLVHGVPGGARDFRYLSPVLDDRFRLIRVELPGFGTLRDLQDVWSDYTVDGRADLVGALLDELGIESFGALGHSMGGPVAMALAARDSRTRFLVLLASVGLTRHRGMFLPPRAAYLFGQALRLPVVGDFLLKKMKEAYEKLRFREGKDLTIPEARTHVAPIAQYDFDRVAELADAVNVPTLVAFAVDDQQVEPEIGHELAERISTARSLIFESGGHNIQKTRAAELGGAIASLSSQ